MKLKKIYKKLKLTVFNNLHLKLLSLFVAFLLWLNVASFSKTKYQIHSYVDIVNLPENLEIVKIKPEKVNIILEGRKNNINSKLTDIAVYVDGKKLKVGRNKVSVNVFVPTEDLTLISVEPESVIIFTRKKINLEE